VFIQCFDRFLFIIGIEKEKKINGKKILPVVVFLWMANERRIPILFAS
jgi:hypothetical protein